MCDSIGVTNTVVLYPADETGCGSYRMIWPGRAAAAAGHDVRIYPPGHEQRLQATIVTDEQGYNQVHSVIPPAADVVVFQRPLSRLYVEAMAELKKLGLKIVVELDDDFQSTSPRNHAHRLVNPATSPASNWLHLERAVAIADLLIASTPSIAARYSSTTTTIVMPNVVPACYLDIEQQPPLVPGWAGVIGTHPDDLQVVGGSVAAAMARAESDHFGVVGPGDGVARALGLPDAKVHRTGWVDPADYAATVAATMAVGIAPLDDTAFNRAKSWLKPLEMAAVGVPCVMSPLPEYEALARFGIGTIASKPAAWRGAVAGLLMDDARRQDAAAAGRQAVIDHGLTIEARIDEWWGAWTSVV